MLRFCISYDKKQKVILYTHHSFSVPSCGPDFYLSSNTPHSIELHWQAVASECRNGIILKYRYCYRPQGGHKAEYTCREIPQGVEGAANMAMIQGLKPSNTYNMYMSAATMKGFGRDTEWKMIRTPALTQCTGMLGDDLDPPFVKLFYCFGIDDFPHGGKQNGVHTLSQYTL